MAMIAVERAAATDVNYSPIVATGMAVPTTLGGAATHWRFFGRGVMMFAPATNIALILSIFFCRGQQWTEQTPLTLRRYSSISRALQSASLLDGRSHYSTRIDYEAKKNRPPPVAYRRVA